VFHIIVTGPFYFTVLGYLLQVAQILMLLPTIMHKSEIFNNGGHSYTSGEALNCQPGDVLEYVADETVAE
jgi:hypothetical protein